MRKIYSLSILAAMLFAAVSCDPENKDDNKDNSGDAAVFQITNDTHSVSAEGGQLVVDYTFANRPDNGEFTVSYNGANWVTNFSSTDSQLTFYVEKNTGRAREAAMAIQYRYDNGSRILEDSLFISQEGSDYDVFVEARVFSGEFYYAASNQRGQDGYYLWISDRGNVTGAEGMIIDLFAFEDPIYRDSTINGTVYRYITAIPEGTYVWEEGSYQDYQPMTFSQYSRYGIQNAQDQLDNQVYFVKDNENRENGRLKITWLSEDGKNFRCEIAAKGEDGLRYGLNFEGQVYDIPAIGWR